MQEAISSLDKISRNSIEALIRSLEAIEESIGKLDKILSEQGKKDEDCRLLTTVPGVGIIVAMTYKAAIDTPYRFETSYTVGAYMGLSPRQYASGEIDRHGSISKMGPSECRAMLYETAQSLLIPIPISNKTHKKELFLPIIRELSKFITYLICLPNNDYWYKYVWTYLSTYSLAVSI